MLNAGVTTPNALSPVLEAHVSMFACPACGGPLSLDAVSAKCAKCAHTYAVTDGLPRLFVPNNWDRKSDVTDAMKTFYEETPFPNYDNVDSKWRLIEKAERGLFANLLNKQILYGVKILEAGCGTGQLTNYLGVAAGRMVIGADMCVNSLRLAENFRAKNDIANAAFVQMNLFRPSFKPESFDVVISNGVLHHTSDPYAAFRSILGLVKKGGFVVVGLYNTYGRLPTDARRVFFRLTGGAFRSLDPHLRSKMSSDKKRAWFMDQYRNPHESKHTMGEVLQWFDENAVEFVNGVPKPAMAPFGENEKLFKPTSRGTPTSRLAAQLNLILTSGWEGGLFIMIGRKKA